MSSDLREWRRRWTAAGLPTIPLDQKRAVCEAWQLRPTAEQWAEVGSEYAGNIAVLCGQGVAVADADNKHDPQTSSRIETYLAGLGVDPKTVPTVQTASLSGRHYYLAVGTDAPSGNYSIIAPTIGTGELRYGRGAYVVAPSSEVGGEPYRFVRLYPEAIKRQRPLAWRDLYPLLGTAPQGLPELEAPPVQLVWRPMPDRAKTLLRALAVTDAPTVPFMGYTSRSEAEAATVALLILAGWSYAEIAATFARYRPGHYADHNKPDSYLARTYRNVLTYLAASPTRLQLAGAYHAAEAIPWPGRGGGLDFATYRALCATGWTFDTLTPTASLRWLAEHAAASPRGISYALDRLQDAGLAVNRSPWKPEPLRATTWEIAPLEPLSDCDYLCKYCASDGLGEVWARAYEGQDVGTLGKSAALVLGALTNEPQGVVELAAATGKHRNTVRPALARLAAWDLAEQVSGGWIRGPGDLRAVAEAMRAREAATHRRLMHDLQREGWQYLRGRNE